MCWWGLFSISHRETADTFSPFFFLIISLGVVYIKIKWRHATSSAAEAPETLCAVCKSVAVSGRINVRWPRDHRQQQPKILYSFSSPFCFVWQTHTHFLFCMYICTVYVCCCCCCCWLFYFGVLHTDARSRHTSYFFLSISIVNDEPWRERAES